MKRLQLFAILIVYGRDIKQVQRRRRNERNIFEFDEKNLNDF